MRQVLMLLFCFVTSNLQAQGTYQINWSGIVGSSYTAGGAVGYGREFIHKLASDVENNVYFIGTYQDAFPLTLGAGSFSMNYPPYAAQAPSYDKLYYLGKCNSNGDLLWVKRLSQDFLNPYNELYTKLNALTLHPDGHIIVGGSSHEYVPYPFTNYELVEAKVWKLDTSGNVIWSKVFPTVNKWFSGTSEIAHVQCDTAGNVVLIGQFTDSLDCDPSSGVHWLRAGDTNISRDIFMIKLDALGNLLWGKSISGTYWEELYDASINQNNQIYISGRCGSFTDFDPDTATHFLDTSINSAPFVASYSPDGAFRWVANLHAPLLHVSSTNQLLLAGNLAQSQNLNPLGNPILPPLQTGTASHLAAYDTSGQNLWYRIFYANSNTADLDFRTLTSGPDQRIHLAGDYFGKIDFDPESSVMYTDTLNSKSFILQLDDAGRFMSAKGFNQSSTTSPRIEIYDQLINTSNEIILSGRLYNSVTSNSDSSDLNPDANQMNMVFPAGTADGFLVNLTNCTLQRYDTLMACDSIEIGGITFHSSFSYNYTFPSNATCDTVLHTYYHLIQIDTAIVQNGFTLTAQDTSCSYQWIRCNPLVVLLNDTLQSYTPSVNGQYAVILSNGGCQDTSSCISVQATSIGAWIEEAAWSVFPNPSDGVIRIAIPAAKRLKGKRIWNLQGQMMQSDDTPTATLYLNPLANGLYLIEIQTDTGSIWKQLRIQHSR
ncbi:MAG: T9SS type A sorting domain-containing protein [Chitinophagaceae bacterium]|nr:T9SS type A sorting domain-containing protein [Chitinophagaceae bacterium]